MAPKLYGDNRSPCVRAVLLAAEAMKIKLEYVAIDVVKKEHLTNEYINLNSRHTVPTLDDDGFVVWDSHAIMMYLGEKYGNDNSLYPKDIKKRALINQKLLFDAGDLFSISRYIAGFFLYKRQPNFPQDLAEALDKAYGFLETFLTESKYVAGDEMTIADFSLWTSISNSSGFVAIDAAKYPKITAWSKKLGELPYSHLNFEGQKEFKKILEVLKAQ
ncbi:glutathione S-transferase 1-like [Diabrotica undecimpunctata]|uniref:glutathione S-transferase 1-like n=2 Tax=Diabrotica undecimpunctata TaxID=50387 RepID=UPI003B63EF76